MNKDNLYNIEEKYEAPVSVEDLPVVDYESEYVIDEAFDDNICTMIADDDNDNEAWHGGYESIKKRDKSPILLLFGILSNPVDGWKQLKRAKLSVEKIAASLFYPALALAAVSEFTDLFYNSDRNFTDLISPAILTFMTFFFSYFTIMIVSDILLPSSCKGILKTDFGKECIMINISTLAMFYFLYRLIPFAGPVIGFLPLWTAYIGYKGAKILRVPDNKETYVCCVILILLLCSLLLWDFIFDYFLKFI